MEGMPPRSLLTSSFGTSAPFEPSTPVQDIYLENYGGYTGAGPLPPTVPATHAHTEVIPRQIPNSSFSTLAGALEPILESPHRIHTLPFSSLIVAVDPIRGPWRELAREITEAPRESVSRVLAEVPPQVPIPASIAVPAPVPELTPPPMPQEPVEDADQGPPRKKAKVIDGNEKQREGEGQRGIQGGSGVERRRKVVRRRRRAPIEGCGKFSVMRPQDYVARRRETVGARDQIPVVRPQVHGSTLQRTTYTSTTSTHRVENPTGEPVPETVPQSFGGSWTAAPGEEEETARKRKSADPHVCDECGMRLSCPSDMARHKAGRDHGKLAKFKCDECGAPFFRKDAVHRHKKEHCKYRRRRSGDEHDGEGDGDGGRSQDWRRDGQAGGEGGMGPMGGCMLSW